jgi:GNAT superfamily N-acetyltransferase
MARIELTADHQIVALGEADAEEGLKLSIIAGWNQTLADWRILLRLGRGFGVRSDASHLVATGIALPHPPDFGWIGMVLVHPDFRRLGLATMLLHRTIDQLRSMGLVPMLDATPAGKPVYERLGFLPVEEISRWRRGPDHKAVAAQSSGALSNGIAPDRRAFGADRHRLLAELAGRPGSSVLTDPEQDGYAICRQGRTAVHIGPAVSEVRARHGALLKTAFGLTCGPVIVDIPQRADAARDAAVAAGFAIERPLTRMALGRSGAFGAPEMVAAIAGPEFG